MGATRLLGLLACMTAAACANQPGLDTPIGATGSPTFDIGSFDSARADTESPTADAAAPNDTRAQPGDATATPDIAAPKDASGPCSGEAGCACTENGQCLSGFCVEDGGAAVCAKTCTTDCPAGFACKTVSTSPSDVVTVCLPRFPRLCEPCNADSECQSPASPSALCVPYGEPGKDSPGSFCGGTCDDKNVCPGGYVCAEVKNAGGATVKQCRRTDLKCPCDERAAKLGLSTACQQSNTFGSCTGARSCSDKGLSACSATKPAAETCNGLDDDCDASTDEAACDDKNPCTMDQCDPLAKKCAHLQTTAPCDDGSVCTTGDVCGAGGCTGKAKSCDDSNPCTDDKCDAAKGCTYADVTGPCTPDTACVVGALCKAGECQGGKPKDCNDKNPCTADSCDAAGKCTSKPVPTPCDDGNACTTSDTCKDAVCAGSAKNCDDGNPCTDDACDPGGVGCKNSNAAGKCDDSNACTQKDFCQAGTCVGQALPCDDVNPCTDDKCAPVGGCKSVANAAGCDDGNPCTGSDGCSGGKCQGGANACGCTVDADCASQANPNLCAGKLVCDKAKAPYTCVTDPKTAVTCDTSKDGPCLKTACDAKTGKCGASATGDGAVCDDGDPCTKTDKCSSGACKGLGGAGCCTKDADCSDGNACTKDSCFVATGACSYDSKAMEAQVCDADGTGCTQNDTCSAGKCQIGKPVDCTGDACNNGACSSTGPTTSTCKKTPKAAGTPCEDGLFCTDAETCNANGQCTGGKPKDCAGSGCSAGSCSEAAKKCEGTPKPDGTLCNADNNGCTKNDACKAGACVAGSLMDCSNPFDVCNDWACGPLSATEGQCAPKPKLKGAACEDGKFCTAGDACDGGGKCVAGTPLDCKQVTDSCNDGACDEAAKKCAAKAKTDGTPCNDGDVCTPTDVCKTGVCVGQSNACGDFKVSMFKTVQGAPKRASVADVGSGDGRWRAVWGGEANTVFGRLYRNDWSREGTEQVVGAGGGEALVQVATIPAGPGAGGAGEHDVLWASEQTTSTPCWTYKFSSNQCANTCFSSQSACANVYSFSSCSAITRYTLMNKLQWQRYGATGNAVGAAFTVHTYNSGCVLSPPAAGITQFAAAGRADGKRLVVYAVSGTNYRVLLNADGSVLKNLGTDTAMKGYDVAAFSDGRTILAWDDGADIKAQVYASSGDLDGTVIAVNDVTAGKQGVPAVDTMPNGRFVISWNTDTNGGDVAARVFKQDNSPLAPEMVVNTSTAGVQAAPAIGMFQDGSFVIAFEDASGKDGAAYGILGQWYTSVGGKVGGEKVIDAITAGDQRYPVATGLKSDEVVIAWTNLADGHVYARKWDKGGNALNGAKEFLANTLKTGEQGDPALAVGGDGSFVVAWDSEAADGDGAGVSFQRYQSDATPAGGEVLANTFKKGPQLRRSAATSSAPLPWRGTRSTRTANWKASTASASRPTARRRARNSRSTRPPRTSSSGRRWRCCRRASSWWRGSRSARPLAPATT